MGHGMQAAHEHGETADVGVLVVDSRAHRAGQYLNSVSPAVHWDD